MWCAIVPGEDDLLRVEGSNRVVLLRGTAACLRLREAALLFLAAVTVGWTVVNARARHASAVPHELQSVICARIADIAGDGAGRRDDQDSVEGVPRPVQAASIGKVNQRSSFSRQGLILYLRLLRSAVAFPRRIFFSVFWGGLEIAVRLFTSIAGSSL